VEQGDHLERPPSVGAAIAPSARIRLATGETKAVAELRRGDRLSTGSTVAGVIQKLVTETVTLEGTEMTPTTLYWSPEGQWKRAGAAAREARAVGAVATPKVYYSCVVVPNSQIELESGLRIRDYLEWCSPDTEAPYRVAMGA